LATFTKRHQNLFVVFSTTSLVLFLPTYSMTHWRPLNRGSNWKAHLLCATTRLKVCVNA
jgi:hypothetical protein